MKTKLLLLSILLAAGIAVGGERPVKVACIGNSITYGTGVENREYNSYPSVLQRMLGDGYVVGNFGRPGATLLHRGHRPYYLQPEYADALAFKPDIAIIKLGTNDTDPRDWPEFRDDFAADYAALLDTLRAVNPDMRIIMSRLSVITVNHRRFNAGTRQYRDSINALIEGIAAARGIELIDLAGGLIDRQNLIPDALHPNAEGAQILARAAYSGITGNYGGLAMAPVYSSGMVLQRDRPIKLRGRANAGERVRVELGGDVRFATTDNRGRWTVTMPPQQAAEGLVMTVEAPSGKLVFDNVAVGEVWLASGQSNMGFIVRDSTGADSILAACEDASLRFFNMQPSLMTNKKQWPDDKLRAVDTLNYYLPTHWAAAKRESVAKMSAVAYNFARVLRDSLKVPVGIIANPIGGTTAESWADVEILMERFPVILRDWRHNHYIHPWVQERAGQNTGADAAGLAHRHPYEPSYLFATGMKPLDSYPINGVIWYQGESNAGYNEVHEQIFPLVVESVRRRWEAPELPFLFVQLSSVSRPSWPAFRDSQRRLAKRVKNTGMVVSHDYGDSLDVHPREKRPVGQRLARLALHDVYGFSGIVPQGPSPLRASLNPDGTITVEFDYCDGLSTSDGAAPRTFEVAALDGIFRPATAIIKDNKIILKDFGIENPAAVRYAWQPFTRANLVNGASLPASTFRLDIAKPLSQAEDGIDFGLSGAAGGFLGGEAIVAGGCNFPVNTLAPDSRKQFYRGIYRVDENGLEIRAALPQPLAYAASATVPGGVVVAGGLTPDGPVADCWLIRPDYSIEALPSLPATVDNATAAAIGSRIYVVGGNHNGTPSNSLLVLDTANPSRGWTKLRDFPGNPRTQCCAAASDGKIYIFGGFAISENPTLETSALVYNPAKNRWSNIPAPPQDISLGGGVAATMPDGRIVAVGGVNADVFLNAIRSTPADYLSHPAPWYRINPNVLVFNPKTQKWTLTPGTETARAGATLFPVSSDLLMLYGGEIKPRVRTPRVSFISLLDR